MLVGIKNVTLIAAKRLSYCSRSSNANLGHAEKCHTFHVYVQTIFACFMLNSIFDNPSASSDDPPGANHHQIRCTLPPRVCFINEIIEVYLSAFKPEFIVFFCQIFPHLIVKINLKNCFVALTYGNNGSVFILNVIMLDKTHVA